MPTVRHHVPPGSQDQGLPLAAGHRSRRVLGRGVDQAQGQQPPPSVGAPAMIEHAQPVLQFGSSVRCSPARSFAVLRALEVRPTAGQSSPRSPMTEELSTVPATFPGVAPVVWFGGLVRGLPRVSQGDGSLSGVPSRCHPGRITWTRLVSTPRTVAKGWVACNPPALRRLRGSARSAVTGSNPRGTPSGTATPPPAGAVPGSKTGGNRDPAVA